MSDEDVRVMLEDENEGQEEDIDNSESAFAHTESNVKQRRNKRIQQPNETEDDSDEELVVFGESKVKKRRNKKNNEEDEYTDERKGLFSSFKSRLKKKDNDEDDSSVDEDDWDEIEETRDFSNSAFEIDEDEGDFIDRNASFFRQNKKNGEKEVHEASEETIKDVLEVLGIKPTFDIEKDVFLPSDLEDHSFDLQAPYGYDQGQVNNFYAKTKVSVDRYVELLIQRNEDLAKIATVVDKLQVDLHNLRYENEIANGINIMPTNDVATENELMDAKLRIRKLEDQIKRMKFENSDALTSNERTKFEGLQDEISILRRENNTLNEENYQLRNRVAVLEESADYVDDTEVTNSEFSLDDADSFDNTSITKTADDELPVFDLENDYEEQKSVPQSSGVFDLDDDEDIFSNAGGKKDDDFNSFFDDDDEDEIFRQLQNR